MNPFRLLDGDRILTLFAIFIKQQLDILELEPPRVTMGVCLSLLAHLLLFSFPGFGMFVLSRESQAQENF